MDLNQFIELALREEFTKNKSRFEAPGISKKNGRMRLTAGEDLVMSGTECFERCLQHVDPQVKINWHFKNGDLILRDQSIASVQGDLAQIIKVDQLAVNFLQHLSGVATLTRLYRKRIEGTQCKITDSFQTTPIMGFLEKQAIIDGGGYNRSLEQLNGRSYVSLNQVSAYGGLEAFLSEVELDQPICLEVSSAKNTELAIENSVSCIVFKGLEDKDLKSLLPKVPAEIITDCIGELSLERTETLAQLGLNYLSIEDLTQSAPCANFSFFIEWGSN